MIELLNIDCMTYMATVPDKYFDLAIVDPPYGIREDGHRENQTRSKLAVSKKYHAALWDQGRPDKKYFAELQRISNNQIIWGANHLADLFNAKSSCWLVWNKAVLSGNKNHFADCELAFASFPTAVRSFEFEWQGMIQGNMKDKEDRIHPTQKPVQLYKWLLKNYAKPEYKIIDTHLGSGSSAIAAYDFGIAEFVGTEIDKEYFEAAKLRFETHKRQLTLAL
jgi:site-specific DNA-methyltransferase (adenine-specific)